MRQIQKRKMHLELPFKNEARGTIQYFNIFVSEAPVDAKVAVGLVRQIHIVVVQK